MMDGQFNLYKRTSNPRPRLPPNDYYYNHPRSDNEELRAYRRPKMSQRSSSSERDEWSYARPSRQSNYNFRDVDNAGRPQYDDEEDYVARQRRTTAIQRNTSNRQPSRVQPRDLEVRRQWISSGGDTVTRTSLEHHATRIANRMEQDETLMEDTPESEQLRREALRDMPQCLTIKRHIKSRLLKSVSKRSKGKPLGFFKRMKYRWNMRFSEIKASLKNLTYTFELWYSTLKTIEGHFGSGVATYFRFFRWLFIINVLVAVPAIVFIVIPQILYDVFQSNNETYYERDEFSGKDLVTGEGFFTNTLMYYGYYVNETISITGSLTYNVPYAYFFTMLAIYFACFIVLSISMAHSYRRNFIETEGGLHNIFAHKVFCGWDYSIATKEAAVLKSSSLYVELKELLSDLDAYSVKKSCFSVFRTRTIQLVANLIIAILLGGTGYLMWYLLEKHRSTLSGDSEGVIPILTAVVINCVMLVYPIMFSYLVRCEDYKDPRTALNITLIRTFLLELVVVGVLITFWLSHSGDEQCWETSLGQEIYRLILFDFLFSVLLATLFGLLRLFVYKYIWSGIGGEEFDIARHTLNLIYNQTLFWVGLLLSPLLSIVVVIKLLCVWYVRSSSVLAFCKPSTKSWRAAQTQTWFLILTFLSLLMVFGINGYVLTSVQTSDCGPFRNYEYIYEIVLEGVLHLEQNGTFWKVLMYFTKPGVIALILIALGVRVYYLRAKAHAQRGMVKILREMLIWEAKDKEFLLEHISKVTQGQWQYKLQEGRADVMDPYYTAPNVYRSNESNEQSPVNNFGDSVRASESYTSSSGGYRYSNVPSHLSSLSSYDYRDRY